MSLFRYPFVFIIMLAAGLVMAAAVLYGAARKKGVIERVFNKENLIVILRPYNQTLLLVKEIFFVLALFFVFISLAAPQWGIEEIKTQTTLSYTVIAVDVSSSMKARDLPPNRLENAKTMLKILINNLAGQRVGIVVFTSEAYTQSPLTTDGSALKYFVNMLRPDMLRAKGTSISAAIEKSAAMLEKYPGKKTLILLTDGEDHDPEELKKSINAAVDNSIKIIAVGIGTPDGELIPERIEGGQVAEYKKDKEGKTVVTKLDENSLKTLASATSGVYIKYKNFQSAAEQIALAMQDIDTRTEESSLRKGYKNRYQFPLAAALFFLLASMVIPVKKIKKD
ncbi:Ca-activated chloride channel family protein [Elusimicrobium posterum]|uniref:vWA domain-containing protein n=1 Tax=Elusimicrobium posterum TaxID=3116653 RepID=UPI003C71A996